MEKYGIKNGTVFTFKGSKEHYVICDMATHEWKLAVPFEELRDPVIIFRSVANINSQVPVMQQIGIPLSKYKKHCTELSLSDRIQTNTPENL